MFQLERFNRELTGRDWNDSRKYRQRLESINASHGAIAPYAHQLRIILHETKDLEDFSYLCTVAGLPRPIKAHMEAFSNGYYAARNLHNLYLHFKEFDWRVAFQMEAMLRNGLINTQELLQQLYQPIKDLCSCQPATAADTLRLFTDALRSPDLRQSKIDRFRQICGRDPSESLSAHRLSKGNFLCHHVTITPTRMLLEGPFVIQSNRVIRKYQGYEEHFIRVDFRDEDRLQYRWERDVSILLPYCTSTRIDWFCYIDGRHLTAPDKSRGHSEEWLSVGWETVRILGILVFGLAPTCCLVRSSFPASRPWVSRRGEDSHATW